ncbi:hypothetical protein AX14_008558 [Amanita brunnescens Koide BX004]|nr:hypothetical protein AX14_008558 [Amanita brunnescens Koide BX004]
MVFIDQPAGTGFSLASSDHFIQTPHEASEQLWVFLRDSYTVSKHGYLPW